MDFALSLQKLRAGPVAIHAQRRSAEDVDLGTNGDVTRHIEFGLDGEPRGWGQLKEVVLGWVKVPMDG